MVRAAVELIFGQPRKRLHQRQFTLPVGAGPPFLAERGGRIRGPEFQAHRPLQGRIAFEAQRLTQPGHAAGIDPKRLRDLGGADKGQLRPDEPQVFGNALLGGGQVAAERPLQARQSRFGRCRG